MTTELFTQGTINTNNLNSDKKIFALSSTKVVVIVANYLTVSYNTVSV